MTYTPYQELTPYLPMNNEQVMTLLNQNKHKSFVKRILKTANKKKLPHP